MKVFNFIETFFFISLGITFVLILLLIYHFKQRLNTIEQKSDTMFEIINNIVKEITVIKHFCMQPSIPSNSISSHMNLETIPVVKLNQSKVQEEQDYETDEETEDESTDDESDDDETDNDDDKSIASTDSSDSNLSKNEKIIVSDDELSIVDLKTVKVIMVDVHQEQIVDLSQEVLAIKCEEVLEQSEEKVQEFELKLEQEQEEDKAQEQEQEQEDNVKIINTTQPTPQQKTVKEILMETYTKMSTSELKAVVIQKGLNTDPSKLKKPKLLQILEKSIE